MVQVRSRRWLVEEVVPAPVPGHSARVRLACADADVLARLLELNATRAKDEQRSCAAVKAAGKAKTSRKPRRPPPRSGGLFDP
jgi:hypothetical protein